MSESKFQYIDEEKEMSGEEYSDSNVEESPTNNETEVEAESTETPETAEQKLKIGENQFDSVDDKHKHQVINAGLYAVNTISLIPLMTF